MQNEFRPPAVPLITNDPYFSIWSCADALHHDRTRHWTLAPHDLLGYVRVDGEPYRFMGSAAGERLWFNAGQPSGMRQTGVQVEPTTTRYAFEDGGVALTVRFTTPLLTDDLDVLSRPLTYVELALESADGSAHDVDILIEAGPTIVTSDADARLVWERAPTGDWTSLRLGTWEQNVLAHRGDHVTIAWGYAHLIAPPDAEARIADGATVRAAFVETGAIGETDDQLEGRGRSRHEGAPSLLAAWSAAVRPGETARKRALFGYDDCGSIDYFGSVRRAWCFRDGASFADVTGAAITEWDDVLARCDRFDADLLARARELGGDAYADLVGLAYRQSIGAHKLIADEDGRPVFLSKECSSNGSIGTVDVALPSSPLFLLLEPALVDAMLRPVLRYAESPEWDLDFAPHDVGTYPRATGQTYGVRLGVVDHSRQMPVEECGNMLILAAAAVVRSNDLDLVRRHWDTLDRWCDYLVDHGLDPEHQLCTDDFAGHLARNANLSLKAIIAIACFGLLCDATGRVGRRGPGERYRSIAGDYAERWMEMAIEPDAEPPHTRLTFDGEGTWSLKYNLVWDRFFGFDLFPESLALDEVAFYESRADEYGVPMDNRARFTKSDWLIWAGSLTPNRATVERFSGWVRRFLDATPDRTPFSDWHDTHDAREQNFHNRTTVGGMFMPMLLHDRAQSRPRT